MYRHIFTDPRTRHYIFVGNPLLMVTFVTIYYKFVKDWGPRFMKNREPLQLERAMICYNFLQIVWCFYVAYKVNTWKMYLNTLII